MAFGSFSASAPVSAADLRGFFAAEGFACSCCLSFFPGCFGQLVICWRLDLTDTLICPLDVDFSALAAEFAPVQLGHRSLGVFFERVGDIADTLRVSSLLVGRHKAVADWTDKGEMCQEVGGRRSVRQRRDEKGRAAGVRRDPTVNEQLT